MLNRRAFVVAGAAGAAALTLSPGASHAQALSEDAVHFDKDAPVLGNPKGNVTVVEYFDYQCSHCRRIHPTIKKVVKSDGNIRLVMKDWPIFGEVSVFAAQAVLGAARIGSYEMAMDAVMGMTERPTQSSVSEALESAGLSMTQIAAAVNRHTKEIAALLDRNYAQATAFDFQGTPAFVVGRTTYPGVLDEKMLRMAIADARAELPRQR